MPPIGATTFGAIITAAKQRADLVNSNFISASEWQNMANASLQNLWDKLVETYGSDYEVQNTFAITTDGTNDAYALPTDFYKLLGVDLQLSGSVSQVYGWVTIWRFNFSQRNQWTLPNVTTLWGRTNLRYRLRGGNIWFAPLPAGGQSLRLWYAPRFTPLVNDSDSFDGVNGWEEWAINDIAMKALTKEESDLSGVMALQQVQNDRLASIMENRDAGAAATMVDVYAVNSGFPLGEGGGGDWFP